MSDENLQIFADEAEDLLISAEQALLSLENCDSADDTMDQVNELFRTFHTIKGAAGLFGLDVVVDFTHIVESVLDKLRNGMIAIDDDLISLFLLSRDHLDELVRFVVAGNQQLSDEMKQKDNELAAKLNTYLGSSSAQDVDTATTSVGPTVGDNGVANVNWHISLRFGPSTLSNGMDPASFINYLNNLGELKSVTLIADTIPEWSQFDPESCYLGFELELHAPDTDKEAIADVFEFVQDDCKICILPPHSHIDGYIQLIDDLADEDMRIGDILLACGALTQSEKDNILNAQDTITDNMTAGEETHVPPIGKIAVGEQVVQQQVVDAALKKQGEIKQQHFNAQQSIRVNALKLEDLVNLVGELVIGSANAELHVGRMEDADLNTAMENLLRLVEDVRDTALGLRMVPIGETFDRYKRLVREVSRDTGKDIELRISGAETELDKTLIEKIGDPLMHLVRNAIDHGIESAEQRLQAGKPAQGVLCLDASHDSGSVVIQIRDDGGGLSKEKILNKALEKGIITDEQQLTDQEIYQLIFAPGFSTAETISNLSGRGVGMDVVRRNIEALRGHVGIESEAGIGCTISIRLPLTLAIIDGFRVRVGDAQYIVPLDMVDECIELSSSIRAEDEQSNYINLRGEILPFVKMSELFDVRSDENQPMPSESTAKDSDNIVVVHYADKKAGFVVDQLLGEQQTVIKPLGKVFQNLKGISGTTILGSGEVALIIDVPELLKKVESAGVQPSISLH